MCVRSVGQATATAGALRSLGYFAVCLAALYAASCGGPAPRVIARFRADAGAGGSSDGGEAGAGLGPAEISIPSPRGRVRVVDGSLLTDIGTPLRGLLLPVDTGWSLDDFQMLTDIAETSGLNAVHVYLENSTQTTGAMVNQADALVSLSAQAGLYLIIGIGTGTSIGVFDALKVESFWNYYGARYASSSHVLFEIQNNPEYTCDEPVSAATLALQRDTYAQIRAVAPDSHVLMFSTTSLIEPSVLSDAVQRLGNSVDWSNASFALDLTAECLPLARFSELVAAAKAENVALVIGQLPRDDWGPYISRFEEQQVGWLHIRWFANNDDLASYRTATTAAAVTWCPERGTFPEDSSACR